MGRIIVVVLLFTFISSFVYPDERIVITVVKSRNIVPYNIALRGFKDYLKEKGIDVQIVEYSMEGEGESDLLKIFEEIKLKKPALILALGTPATQNTQEMIKEIPVVFTMVLNPEESKIVPPGVVMDISPEVKLKNLKRVFPDAERIGLIYSQDSTAAYEEISQVSSQFDFQLIKKKINSGKELADALEDIFWQIGCFLMIPDFKIYFPKSVEYLLREGLKKKIPVIGLSSFYTRAGALISFDCDYEDLGKQAGEIALRVLTGENSSTIKFVKPRKVKLSLNLLVAERLGIEISPEIIKEASEVFGK